MGKDYNPAVASNHYMVGSVACLAGGLFGLDVSSMSGVLTNPDYARVFSNPDATAQGAIVASMSAGSVVGGFILTYVGDKIGRKKMVIISGWIWIVGSILQCASMNRGMLVVGRVISGIAMGLSSTVAVYQSEIAPPSIRGRLLSLLQWSVAWGVMFQYFVQFGCSYINGPASFRIPWGLQMIPAIILSTGMLFFPESPRWLVDHDREDEALEILADLHGHGNKDVELVQFEFEEIRRQVRFERTEGAKSYLDLLKPAILRSVSLSCSLQLWVQFGGMNVMLYYMVYVLQGAGLTGRRGNLIAVCVQYTLNVVFAIPAIAYIDRWGRRPMLLVGTLLMGICLFVVGGLQAHYGHWGDVAGNPVWLIEDNKAATRAVIVCSYLFICIFSISMGPATVTYTVEIIPMRVRVKAIGLATAISWFLSFVLTWAIPPALATIAWKTYFIFGIFNFAAFIHIFFMFPETKQRNLEQIGEVFAQGHTFSAWAIPKAVQKESAQDIWEMGSIEKRFNEL